MQRTEVLYSTDLHLRHIPLHQDDTYEDVRNFILKMISGRFSSGIACEGVFSAFSSVLPDIDENGMDKAIYMVTAALHIIEHNEVSHYRFYEAYKDSMDILSGDYDDCFHNKSDLEAFKVDIAKLMEYLDKHPEYKTCPADSNI